MPRWWPPAPCPGKRRGIVDAIAHHRYFLTTILQTPDFLFLVLREYLRHNTVHANLTPDRFCCFRIISGQHNHLNAHSRQFLYCLLAGRLYNVSYGNHTDKLTTTGKEQRCFSINGQLFPHLQECAAVNTVRRHQTSVSGKAEFILNLTHNTLTWNLFKIFYWQEGKSFIFRFRHNRICQWMLRQFFQGSRNLQQFPLPDVIFA